MGGRGVLSVLALLVVETCQLSGVPSAQFGTFDFLELENTAYQVEIATAPVSELQLQESLQAGEDEVAHMPVVSKHGQLYSCTLPTPPPLTQTEETRPSTETLPNITTLLERLGHHGCLIKTVGWWTYEYCHGQFVRQYHMEAGRIVGDTKYLGFYEKETVWDQEHVTRVKRLLDSFKGNMVASHTQAYHTVLFVNGTECDISSQPRTAKVEIFCTVEGVDKLVEVKEETTCNYTIMVHTPLLCQHPMLLPLASFTPRHTLSCTPVVSQLDYEDYLLKQELVRQQKKKLKVLGKETSQSKEEADSLLNSDQQLLRKLVMSSITQLAEIAYDTGSLGLSRREERELDEIDDNDKEVGGSSLSLERGGGAKEQGSEDRVRETEKLKEEDGDKVSEKMKKMAEDVKSTGKDSTLESLLSNLAVTAQYIESLEGNGGDPSNMVRDEVPSAGEETGEPEEGYQEPRGGDVHTHVDSTTDKDDPSVEGPPPVEGSNKKGQSTVAGSSSSGQDGGATGSRSEEERTVGRSISSEILAASELEKEEEEEGGGFELPPDILREVEQQLQEALAKQLNTDDVTVKIVTLPEDQLRQMEGEGEGEEVESGRNGRDRDQELTNAMSLFLDSLLTGAEEPEPEDRQRQSELAASYDQIWGREQRKQRTQKDT